MRGVRESSEGGHCPPGNQNACNPDTGADFVQQQVARNSKEQVAKKEDPSEQTELLARDRQLLVHRQRRKPNVDPVEKADDVQQENKGRIRTWTFRIVLASIGSGRVSISLLMISLA